MMNPTDMPEQQASAVELLPYRTNRNDNFDKMYATTLKISYQTLPYELRVEFDIFTHNLMDEEYINRNSLLDATECFYTYFPHLCNAAYTWPRFTDNAWNYRPYQMW